MAARYARVEVYRSDSALMAWDDEARMIRYGGRWRWRFVSTNGKVVADSAEGYQRRRWCLHGAEVALALPGIQGILPGETFTVQRGKTFVRVGVVA